MSCCAARDQWQNGTCAPLHDVLIAPNLPSMCAYIPAAALLATEGCDVAQVEVKRAVKKEDMAAGAGYDQSYAARTGKAPDWHCPECRNKNFGWREVCKRCQVRAPCRCCFTTCCE